MFDKKSYDRHYYEAHKTEILEKLKVYQLSRYNQMLWISAKNRAKKAGLEFSITREDVVVPDICPILGVGIIPMSPRKYGLGASIDRLNSSKGYTKDNIIVCSLRANMLKSNGTIEEFKKIVTFLSEKT